jgi:chromate reductase
VNLILEKIRIFAFAGSLREKSFNKVLIQTAVKLVPENASIESFDLDNIPPFNQDLEDNPPATVRAFKEKIRNADALLISTPEYNYSISGVLKYAIDWASRPRKSTPLEGKPVAIMSASIGKFGGARAQYHLRQTFVYLDMHPINKPEVMLSDAEHNVNSNGQLTNDQTKLLVRQLLDALVNWTMLLKTKPEVH